jgi:hypothetical protein
MSKKSKKFDKPLLDALRESLPKDVRNRPDVAAALRGVLIGATLQPKEVLYEEFQPRPAEAESVDLWLIDRPSLQYVTLLRALDGFGLDKKTWFLMCLAWAKRDLAAGQ